MKVLKCKAHNEPLLLQISIAPPLFKVSELFRMSVLKLEKSVHMFMEISSATYHGKLGESLLLKINSDDFRKVLGTNFLITKLSKSSSNVLCSGEENDSTVLITYSK